jgi:hypothetical protein
MSKNILIPKDSTHRSFENIYSMYKEGKCKNINGIFLTDKLHPMIESEKETLIKTINDGQWSSKIKVEFKHKKVLEYNCLQTSRQIKLLSESVMEKAEANGPMIIKSNNKKYTIYPDYVLKPICSSVNLFSGIREFAIEYFKDHDIAWWREDEDGYFPTGHLVSSQIHCLNHLFALREDEDALLAIINNATKMEFDEVLPSFIDEDGYLSFEFAYKNDDLIGENDKGARRGYMWTSIDAMIIARKGKDKWLIPIEWKYTETYEKEDKTCQKRLERYEELIKKSDRLKMPENGQIPHSIYFQEPSYELMRQTLLCEQLIAKDYAVDFFHINIIPKENTELRKAVENEFMQNLTKDAKFKIIDPQELLSPLCDNDKYNDLITYLETRYWNS